MQVLIGVRGSDDDVTEQISVHTAIVETVW